MGVSLVSALALAAMTAPAAVVKVRVQGRAESVPVETYVAWAVAGELGGTGEAEALRAMAVVARTWARTNAGRHRREGFDFCQTTHCQRLDPAAVSERVRRAVEDTGGMILW